MAQDYVEYLAIHVLNEQQMISYRSLSRALKVHCNLAKQMLYDFHRKQNAKKFGSVHATYLLSGSKRTIHEDKRHDHPDDEDTVMHSSPIPPSSSVPQPETSDNTTHRANHCILLVREEELETAKARFESITSIHIYSLEAATISDLCTLSDCNRRVVADYKNEDPLKDWAQYGTIQNPFVKRRERRGIPPADAPPVAAVKVAPKAAHPVKQEATSAAATSRPASAASNRETTGVEKKTTEKPSLNRQASNIFKSFAKTKAVLKKEESQESARPADETPTADFSDEEEAEAGEAASIGIETSAEPVGKSKREREAELQAMMDQEDEEMVDAADASEEDGNQPTVDQAPVEPEASKESVTVENGRRRGRRRVMKKKTVKDEDGYLVTREEAAWESFSEDEPVAKKVKESAVNNSKSGSNAKKSASKPGQGNIMSFFSKK